MKVYFVGAGPGDPQLLTVKAARLLRKARCCICAGSLASPVVLGLLPEDAGRYDSAGMIESVAETLSRHYGAGCPAAVVYCASWPDEKVVRGTLADVAEKVEAAGITRIPMNLVGRALTHVSKLYDKHFRHGYRQGEHSK